MKSSQIIVHLLRLIPVNLLKYTTPIFKRGCVEVVFKRGLCEFKRRFYYFKSYSEIYDEIVNFANFCLSIDDFTNTIETIEKE